MKSDDAVFRALADPSRRRILDLLKARPGTTVGELGERFDFSRFAVMKHLRVLEAVGLVVPRREGKSKRLYLNAVPIQTIYDRWISRYSALWASRLTGLKYTLEEERRPMPAATQVQHVHVVHIRTTPEKLWQALTRPELTRQYYYDTEIRSTFEPGADIEYVRQNKDGTTKKVVTGQVLEAEPNRRLVHTFIFPEISDEPTRVTYEMVPVGDVVRLTMTHEGSTARRRPTGWSVAVGAHFRRAQDTAGDWGPVAFGPAVDELSRPEEDNDERHQPERPVALAPTSRRMRSYKRSRISMSTRMAVGVSTNTTRSASRRITIFSILPLPFPFPLFPAR